jgi:hypothetical protein
LGIDEQSKGFRTYWPDKKTVTTEQNVYHNNTCMSVDCLEGEDWEFKVKMTTNEPVPSIGESIPSTSTQPTPSTPNVVNDPHPVSPDSASEGQLSKEEAVPMKHARKPSKRLADILAGCRVNSTCPSDPKVPAGVQIPTQPIPMLEGEGLADWIMAADFAEEYAMAAEISEAEVLELRSLREAKQHPDWPLWEKVIQEELKVLHNAGTWELTDAPIGGNMVGSKWVFQAKKDAAGNVIQYKARLVAQGFSTLLCPLPNLH